MTKAFYQLNSREILDAFRKLDRKSQLKLLFSLGGVLLFILFILWPAWLQRPLVQAQIRALRGQVQLSQAQIQLEPKLLEERKRHTAFIEETQGRLFKEGETQGILGTLAEMGGKTGVTLLSSHPEENSEKIPPPFNKKYMAISYVITLEGGYHSFATFVSEIENYPKILRIDELSISHQEETPGTHLGEMRLSAFLLQKGTHGTQAKNI